MICGSGGLKARVGNSHCIVNGVGASWLLALFFMFNSSIEFFVMTYDVIGHVLFFTSKLYAGSSMYTFARKVNPRV